MLGKDIVEKLEYYGARVIILDLTNKNFKKNKKNILFEKFDLRNIFSIKKNLEKIVKKHGCPNIFINATYPRSKNRSKSTYQQLTPA